MAELVRGTVADRPWGRTLGTLGTRGLSGELTIHSDGKPYRIAFANGAVVGASSPLVNDAAVRVALTGGLISSIHVNEISRRIAATPDRDEIDVIVDAARLGPDLGQRLRRRLVAQRAARTFSINDGTFVVEDRITVPVVAGNEVDVRAIVYLGAKTNLSEERLAIELNRYGAWFKLTPNGVADLSQFGFSDAEMPILHKLVEGLNLEELERQLPDLGERSVRSVVYALASVGACEIETAPRPVVGRATRNSIPIPSRTQTFSSGPILSRTRTPSPSPSPARTRTPSSRPNPPRTQTPSSNPIPSRAQTPQSGPIPARTQTFSSGPIPSRTQTPQSGPIPARTQTFSSGPIPSRTQTPQSGPVHARTHTPTHASSGRAATGNDVVVSRTSTSPVIGRTATISSRATTGPVISRTISGDRSRVPIADAAAELSGRHREPSGQHVAMPSRMQRASTQTGPRARRNTPATIETEGLIRDRVALLDKGADHFILLGISRDASAELIRAAYFSLARKLHPDRLTSLGITESLRDAQRLFAQINVAFSVLNDPVSRVEYLDILRRGGASAVNDEESKADELAMRIMHAEEAFKRGEMALRREQLDLALQEFATALELKPDEAEYQALHAWATFLNTADKQAIAGQTRSALARAAERLDTSPTPRYYLGRVERLLGREREALAQFQEVLRIKPNHVDASAEVRVLEGRLRHKR